nr:MAG TPA: hypothetical protein [Caudoviricetes sp.]
MIRKDCNPVSLRQNRQGKSSVSVQLLYHVIFSLSSKN